MDYKEGLQPVIGPNPRILILGSLPGDESLRKQEYYGNPRNMFWDVMSGVLGEKAPIRYPERVEYLKRHGIALWDALHVAEREGSLDANINLQEIHPPESFRHQKEDMSLCKHKSDEHLRRMES